MNPIPYTLYDENVVNAIQVQFYGRGRGRATNPEQYFGGGRWVKVHWKDVDLDIIYYFGRRAYKVIKSGERHYIRKVIE